MLTGDRPGPPDDAIDLVLDAAVLLPVNGQSTSMRLTAVDRLNHGLGTTSTLIRVGVAQKYLCFSEKAVL